MALIRRALASRVYRRWLGGLRRMFLSVGAAPGAGPAVADDFTGTDGSAIIGRVSPTGSKTWDGYGPNSWTISSNTAVWAGGSDGGIVVDSGLDDNYEIQFTCVSVTGQYPIGFVLLTTWGGSSFAKLYRDQGADTWTLVTNGTGGGARSSATDVVDGDVLTCRVQGTTVTVLVNGTQVGEWTGVGFVAGRITQGITGSGGLAVTVDNFSVTAI